MRTPKTGKPMSLFRSSYAASAMLVGVGCGSEPDASVDRATAGPAVTVVDSVLLDENDRFYLGNPFSLVVDTADGSFLISDFFENRILRYERAGKLRQFYGRPGGGPGEFRSISTAFVLGDSVVVGAGNRRNLLQLFSRHDGAYVGEQPYSGRPGTGGVSVVDRGVVFPTRDLANGTMAAVWRYPEPAIDYVVPLPAPYQRSLEGRGRFAAFQSFGSVVAWSDTLLSGMSGLNEIYLSTLDGVLLDTLLLPNTTRRGVPPNVQEVFDDLQSFSSMTEMFEAASSMYGLYRMSDGSTVVLHHDSTMDGELPAGNITSEVYLSVIAPNRTTACVDAPVPYSNEMRPVHTVARDTLFLLDRRLNEAEDDLLTWIRAYRIDTSGCTWLDLD
ncbi:MAG: hypothetical protein OXR05_10310 [Gemmatimonadota bacterium]|nr:hypothetical protein [Gemmatimonadota bacterium]